MSKFTANDLIGSIRKYSESIEILSLCKQISWIRRGSELEISSSAMNAATGPDLADELFLVTSYTLLEISVLNFHYM